MSPAVIAVIPLVVLVMSIGIFAWKSSEDMPVEDQVGATLCSLLFAVMGIFAIIYLGNVVLMDTWVTWTVE